ncbi:MAG: hypothetical protein LM590_10025 [Thermofilum sp.]|jgi:hypothetical protein|nr:hypothetical protein [Thermofilum sp.]
MSDAYKAKELWNSINNFYNPKKISRKRTEFYQKILNDALNYRITVIDDPYYTTKGIIFYELLTGKIENKRILNVDKQSIKNLWIELFGKVPESFPEYQVQLTSLLVYAYYHIYTENENYILVPSMLRNMLLKLSEFTTTWLLTLERSNLYIYYKSISFYDFAKLDRKTKLTVYSILGEIHDFLATCNLLTSIAPTIHRRIHFVGSDVEKRAKVVPGTAYHVTITIPGIYFLKKFEEAAPLELQEIYDKLSPLANYHQALWEIANEKIASSLETFQLSGSALVDVVSYEQRLPASVISEIEPVVRSFIIRHELASMVLWLATAKGLKVDFGSFTRGLLKVAR